MKPSSQSFPFSTPMTVRMTDINYGMHLGYLAAAGMFQHARVLFMSQHGFQDLDIGGCGLILVNANYSYKNEAFFNDELMIKVAVGEITRLRFHFLYQSIHQQNGKIIAEGKEEFASFNYATRKPVKIPESFYQFCIANQIDCKTK